MDPLTANPVSCSRPRSLPHCCRVSTKKSDQTEKVRKALDLRFRRHKANPLMQQLRVLAEKHLLGEKPRRS